MEKEDSAKKAWKLLQDVRGITSHNIMDEGYSYLISIAEMWSFEEVVNQIIKKMYENLTKDLGKPDNFSSLKV